MLCELERVTTCESRRELVHYDKSDFISNKHFHHSRLLRGNGNRRQVFRQLANHLVSVRDVCRQNHRLVVALALHLTSLLLYHQLLQLPNRRDLQPRHAAHEHHQLQLLLHRRVAPHGVHDLVLLAHRHRQQLRDFYPSRLAAASTAAHLALQRHCLHQPSAQRRVAARHVTHVAHVESVHAVLHQPHARAQRAEVARGLLREQQAYGSQPPRSPTQLLQVVQEEELVEAEELRDGVAHLVVDLRLQPVAHQRAQHQQPHDGGERGLRVSARQRAYARVRHRHDVQRVALARQDLVLQVPQRAEVVGLGDVGDGAEQLRVRREAIAHSQMGLEVLLLLDDFGQLVLEVDDFVDGAVPAQRTRLRLLYASRRRRAHTLHLDRLLVQRLAHLGDVLVAQLLEEGVAVVQTHHHRLVRLLRVTRPALAHLAHHLLRRRHHATLDAQQLRVTDSPHSHLVEQALVGQRGDEGRHRVGGAVDDDESVDLGRQVHLLHLALHARLQQHVHHRLGVGADRRDVGDDSVVLLHGAQRVGNELEGGEIILQVQVPRGQREKRERRIAGVDFEGKNIVIEGVYVDICVNDGAQLRYAAVSQQLLCYTRYVREEEQIDLRSRLHVTRQIRANLLLLQLLDTRNRQFHVTGDGHEKEHEIGCRKRGHSGSESHKLLRTALLQYGYTFGDEIQRLAQKRIEDNALFPFYLDREAETQLRTWVRNCFRLFCSSSRIATKLSGELTNVGSVAIRIDPALFLENSEQRKSPLFLDLGFYEQEEPSDSSCKSLSCANRIPHE